MQIGNTIYEKNKTVWKATLQVANSKDGRKILYDIHPIKMVEAAGQPSTSTTNNKVSQESGKVNQNLSTISEEQLAEENPERFEAIQEDMQRILSEMSEEELLSSMGSEPEKIVEADVPNLKELLKLQSKMTGGKVWSMESLKKAGNNLLTAANATMDSSKQQEFQNVVRRAYFEMSKPDVDYTTIQEQCRKVAEYMQCFADKR